MARKDEWRRGLATFQRALAKVKKWDEPRDLKSVWAEVVPPTVLSFSFAEFVFPLVAIMPVASSPASVVFLPNFHWGVCCCLEWFLYLAGFYLLATIVHPLEPGWVFTLRVCVCVCVRFVSFNRVCRPVWHSTGILFFFVLVWWLLADRLEKSYIYTHLLVSRETHGGLKTQGRCTILCRAAEVAHSVVHTVFQCGYRLPGHSLVDL